MNLPSPQPDAGVALALEELTVYYGKTLALDRLTAQIPSKTLSGIVGPNGAGKSTLLKAALGLIPHRGRSAFFGERYRKGDLRVVYVPQRRTIDWDFPVTVEDVVRQGRFGHLGLLARFRDEDESAVRTAMERTGVAALAERQIGELSGGQQQRVFLARALAQGGELLLLDEPFAGIDAATEDALLELLRGLRDEGKSVVMVHHDLATVRRHFDHILLLSGTLVASGPPEEALSRETLQKAYGDRLAIIDDLVVTP